MKIFNRKLASGLALILAIGVTEAADYTWSGGSGSWNGGTPWNSGGATAWTSGTGNNAIFTVGSGSLNINTSSVTAGTISVLSSGYSVYSTAGSRTLTAQALSLGSGVGFTLNIANTGAAWSFGSITGAAGASLTITGNANTSNQNANRVNVTSTGTVNVPLIMNGSGAGPTAVVSSGSGNVVTLNGSISSDSLTSAAAIGANQYTTMIVNGTIGGAGAVQFSAGGGGGAGVVVLNAANTYGGNTYLNHSTSGVVRLGTDNALATTTAVFFGTSAGGNPGDGGTLDLNGFNQTVGSLTFTTGSSTVRGIVNTGTSTSTLRLNASSGTASYGGQIGSVLANTDNLTGANSNIAVVKSGLGTQIFSGSSNYSQGTTVNLGTLIAGHNSALGTGAVSLNGGSLQLSSGVYIANTVTFDSASSTYVFDRTAGTSFAGYAASSNLGGMNTTASILSGTASTGRSVTTAFSTTPGSAASNDADRVSDVFSLDGTGSDVFVLQLTYDQTAALAIYDSELDLKLGWYSGGTWVVAADGTFVNGDWNSSYQTVGTYGINTSSNTIWAVLDHNSEYAVIPEPSAYLLFGLGFGLVLWRFRRKRA